jgi:acyl-coenzyme A synthetase/AMP-(fatty) acid ligase
MDSKLAAIAEETMDTQVVEIFGCSEAGSFASRHTVTQEQWCMYDSMNIQRPDGQLNISGGHLAEAVGLADEIEIIDEQHFCFVGRQSDMVKIAGKRISLAELNMRLNAVQGVQDAVFVQPRDMVGVGRLIALVVAPTAELDQIRQALCKTIDPVFLPRPLLKVDSLPRNSANKLPRHELDALLAELGY